MDNNLMRNILYEFEKSNNQTSDLLRLQNDLSNAESELIALQIRFVHKNKENEDLKLQIEYKNRLINENKSKFECKLEKLQSFEFHYNELLNKHKLCLECMNKLRADNQILKERYEYLNDEFNKTEQEKCQLQVLFKEQIEDLDSNLKKLIKENGENVHIIKELRNKTQSKEKELNDEKQLNATLNDKLKQLENELDMLKEEYDHNIGDKCKKINLNEDNIKILELELARVNSKLDQTSFELNDVKSNYLNQVKITDTLKQTTQQKDQMLKDIKINHEKTLIEIENLIKINLKKENDLERIVKEFNLDIEMSNIKNEQEKVDLLKNQKNNENVIKKLTLLYNDQQKKLEVIISLFKSQGIIIKTLKAQISQFSSKILGMKKKIFIYKSKKEENNSQIKSLQEKCFDLETKYSEKCEHLNNLEREIYLTRNSLESAINDLNNMQNIIRDKDDELLSKSEKIKHIESIMNQQSNELNRRKAEINERISQVDAFDRNLKEEKSKLDLKIAHLEANLKSKSKQLHQRIDQIKDMNGIVDSLKESKEQIEFKLQKFENLIKCQKLEIESKSNLLKQHELRIQDTTNELNNVKVFYNQESKRSDNVEDISKAFEIKETQTINYQENVSTQVDEEKNLMADLKINLKIKENLIENINDSLVLKDAEIARLKTRIGLLEREKLNN